MRTMHKLLVGLSFASALSFGVIWGARTPAAQQAVRVLAEDIQKPGHVMLADGGLLIQKPGH